MHSGRVETYPSYPSEAPEPPRSARPGKRAAGGIVGAGAVGWKALSLLKGLAFVGKFKVLASMLVSVVAYSWIFGWWYAVGFVLLIFVHECGHVLALRQMGIKATAPMFIPFLGAFVTMKEQPRSVVQEAVSAMAGPVLGLGAAGVTYWLSQVYDSGLLQALAYAGFFINLFNLLPMLPLDGGRVAGALHPAIWGLGLVAAVAFLFYFPSPVLILVVALGVLEMLRRWRAHRRGQTGTYFQVPALVRAQLGGVYLATAALCVWGMEAAYLPR